MSGAAATGRRVRVSTEVLAQLRASVPLPVGPHLDIGGEGRHPGAVNVNPSPVRTMPGPLAGTPIPDRVRGTSRRIPFADASAARVIVENAPLDARAADEIARVIAPGGEITLLHQMRYARPAHCALLERLGAVRYTQDIVDGVKLLTRIIV